VLRRRRRRRRRRLGLCWRFIEEAREWRELCQTALIRVASFV
jgi:hypothetical protein